MIHFIIYYLFYLAYSLFTVIKDNYVIKIIVCKE